MADMRRQCVDLGSKGNALHCALAQLTAAFLIAGMHRGLDRFGADPFHWGHSCFNGIAE